MSFVKKKMDVTFIENFSQAMLENRPDDALALAVETGNYDLLPWISVEFTGLPATTRVVEGILKDPRHHVDPNEHNIFASCWYGVNQQIGRTKNIDFSLLDVLLDDPRIKVSLNEHDYNNSVPEMQDYLLSHPKLQSVQKVYQITRV